MSVEHRCSSKDALICLGTRRGRVTRERPFWLPGSLQPLTFSSSALSFTRSSTRHSGAKQPLRSTVIKHPLSRGELGTCRLPRHLRSAWPPRPPGRPARTRTTPHRPPGAAGTDGAIILVFPPEGPRCSGDRAVVVRHIIRHVSGQCGGLAGEGWRSRPSPPPHARRSPKRITLPRPLLEQG